MSNFKGFSIDVLIGKKSQSRDLMEKEILEMQEVVIKKGVFGEAFDEIQKNVKSYINILSPKAKMSIVRLFSTDYLNTMFNLAKNRHISVYEVAIETIVSSYTQLIPKGFIFIKDQKIISKVISDTIFSSIQQVTQENNTLILAKILGMDYICYELHDNGHGGCFKSAKDSVRSATGQFFAERESTRYLHELLEAYPRKYYISPDWLVVCLDMKGAVKLLETYNSFVKTPISETEKQQMYKMDEIHKEINEELTDVNLIIVHQILKNHLQ